MNQPEKTRMKLIGRREFIGFPALDLDHIEAKIDTGAYTSSLHVETITIEKEDERDVLVFTIGIKEVRTFRFKDFGQKVIKNSFGEMEERYVIRTAVKIGGRRIRSVISLSNRDNMRFPVLIGRRLIKGKFLIDVKQVHTGGIRLKKAFKMYKTSLP
jgi:hypothetical protein